MREGRMEARVPLESRTGEAHRRCGSPPEKLDLPLHRANRLLTSSFPPFAPLNSESLPSVLLKARNPPAFQERLSAAPNHDQIASIAGEQDHSPGKPSLLRKKAEALAPLSDEDLESRGRQAVLPFLGGIQRAILSDLVEKTTLKAGKLASRPTPAALSPTSSDHRRSGRLDSPPADPLRPRAEREPARHGSSGRIADRRSAPEGTVGHASTRLSHPMKRGGPGTRTRPAPNGTPPPRTAPETHRVLFSSTTGGLSPHARQSWSLRSLLSVTYW